MSEDNTPAPPPVQSGVVRVVLRMRRENRCECDYGPESYEVAVLSNDYWEARCGKCHRAIFTIEPPYRWMPTEVAA